MGSNGRGSECYGDLFRGLGAGERSLGVLRMEVEVWAVAELTDCSSLGPSLIMCCWVSNVEHCSSAVEFGYFRNQKSCFSSCPITPAVCGENISASSTL